jgi:hypothetical protein
VTGAKDLGILPRSRREATAFIDRLIDYVNTWML